MERPSVRRGGVIALAVTALLMTASLASAHESREVGPYEFVVGWSDEPAFANQPNGPEVTITDAKGDPVVEGVELEVEITFGDESMTAEMEPAFVVGVFGEPGNYNTDIFPTRPGTWVFHFTGTVEGEEIDEEFTSGPETFNDVEDPATTAFPIADPNNAELADRLEQESAELAAAADDASSAGTLALIAIVVGGVALLAGLTLGGLALRRRPAGPTGGVTERTEHAGRRAQG